MVYAIESCLVLWLKLLCALQLVMFKNLFFRCFKTFFVFFCFYPRNAMLARVCKSNVSVRLSVCPSLTRRYCVKTKKASDVISSFSGSPTILVLHFV